MTKKSESVLKEAQGIAMKKLKHPVPCEGKWFRVTRNERLIIPKTPEKKRKRA